MSATERAIGPFTPNPSNGMALGAIGTSPTVGRSATMLLKLAGLRSEPPDIAAVSQRQEAGGKGRPGAAARSAGRLCDVVWVDGRAIDRVIALRAHAELGHVGLADRDHTGLAQSLDQYRVCGRHAILVDR